MPYPTEDNITNPCKEFKVPMKYQIEISAEKINSFCSFPSYFLCLLFKVKFKKRVNFLKMMKIKCQ